MRYCMNFYLKWHRNYAWSKLEFDIYLITRLNMLFSPTLPQLENAVKQTEQPDKQYAQQHPTYHSMQHTM